jgi:DNA (cytosine-5)-methyltransferase 1
MTIAQLPIPNFIRPSARRASVIGEEIIVDNFAGGGGASTGIEVALNRSVDIAINHDKEAIEMHRRNHPRTHHLCESVWDVDPVQVCGGRPVGVAWFSPDCKHFSRAKGAKPVSKKIRGLAWVAVKWARMDGRPINGVPPRRRLRPRVIFLENVREFQEWGPLDANNMPCKRRKGDTFRRFVAMLRNLGYAVEWKVLNASSFGAPTHRRRLFIIARCDGSAIVWPDATHGPAEKCHADQVTSVSPVLCGKDGVDPSKARCQKGRSEKLAQGFRTILDAACSGRTDRVAAGSDSWARVREKSGGGSSGCSQYGNDGRGRTASPLQRLIPYRTAAECIDWNLPCPSIFERKRPLAEKTMRRIAMGLKKYVFDNPAPFIVQLAHGGTGSWEESRAKRPNEPLGTVHAGGGNHALVAPHLVEVANSNWSQGHRAVDVPAPTVTARPKGGSWAMAAPVLIGTGGPEYSAKPRSANAPYGTLTAENHTAVVAAFLNKYRGDSPGSSAADPVPTITSGCGSARPAGAAHALGMTVAHLTKFYGTNTGSDPREPMPTVTATGQHLGEVRAFLIKYFGCGCGQPCTEPLHTVTTKDRFGLVTVNGQEYAIADIGLRMLTPRELLRAQFGPELAADYILPATASAAVAKIGNSVAPLCAAAIVRANCPEMIVTKRRRTA